VAVTIEIVNFSKNCINLNQNGNRDENEKAARQSAGQPFWMKL
jgi:hypothetical protein